MDKHKPILYIKLNCTNITANAQQQKAIKTRSNPKSFHYLGYVEPKGKKTRLHICTYFSIDYDGWNPNP